MTLNHVWSEAPVGGSTNQLWNSLEIAKLVAACATPLVLFLLGIWLERFLRRIEQLQWANRKLVERRLQVYDDVAPLLNDLLCYFAYVGNWKELTPRQMVDTKRLLDKKMHLAAPLFTVRLLTAYNTFIYLCFQTYNEMGADAKLRTQFEDRKPFSRDPWQADWDVLFASAQSIVDPREVINAYEALVSLMAEEIGVGITAPRSLLARVEHQIQLAAPPGWWRRTFGRRETAS